MKDVKRMDKPSSGLKVEMHIIFGKISKQFKRELGASKLLTAACGNPGIDVVNKKSVKETYV